MTSDAGNLRFSRIYKEHDNIIVGDGSPLQISHVGNTILNTSHGKIDLDKVLVVPEIKKNLLSVSQLTKNHSCLFEFCSSGFKIKDKENGRILARRHKQGGLYALDREKADEALLAIKNGRAPVDLWHQ